MDRRSLIVGGTAGAAALALSPRSAAAATAQTTAPAAAQPAAAPKTAAPDARPVSPRPTVQMVWPPAETMPLWPGPPPGTPGRRPTAPAGTLAPRIGVYRPYRPNGRSVLVIPGGGFSFIAYDNEGVQVAQKLLMHGTTVFVLDYRLPGDGWASREWASFQDAQRAIRLIRARSRYFQIDPARLGVLGFSAGGLLAALLAVGPDDPHHDPVDQLDTSSARPAFVGLAYAVSSLTDASPLSRSRSALLGDNPARASLTPFATDKRLTKEAPPLFLIHALDDRVVLPSLSLDLFAAATREKVPVEAHFLERGGHGFGAIPARTSTATDWTEWFARWTLQRS